MLDCHSCTWPWRKGNRDDRSLVLHVGQNSSEGVHTLAHLGGRVSARGTLMLLDVQRATAYSNHNQHSNSVIDSFNPIRLPSQSLPSGRFVETRTISPCPVAFLPLFLAWSRLNLRTGPRLRRSFMVVVCFRWKRVKLTASSAESVRLVVTLTKAGGTLRYTQEQQSASSRNITNRVSI